MLKKYDRLNCTPKKKKKRQPLINRGLCRTYGGSHNTRGLLNEYYS